MKPYILLVCFVLMTTAGFSQRFLRVYDREGKRIATGTFRATTDSGIILHQGRVDFEISYRSIGAIRAYRTIFHDILLSSLATVSTGFIVGSIQDGQTKKSSSNQTDYYPFNFTLNMPSNTEFNVAAGVLAGQLIGSGIFLAKKKRRYEFDGSYSAWLAARPVLENELKK